MQNTLYISKEVLNHFKDIFPNRLPIMLGTTPEELAFLQGQQSVINKMESIHNDIQNNEE